MKRLLPSLASVLALCACATLWAQGQGKVIKYAVDAATTSPSATVIKNGDGVVVVTFRAPLQAGGTYSFRLDMLTRSTKVHFPVLADVAAEGNSWLSAAFSPSQVEFTGPNVTASSVVTVTVQPGAPSTGRLKLTIKAEGEHGSRLAKGNGVKVVIIGGRAAAASPEERMLQDAIEALVPEGEAPEPLPR